MRKEHDFLGELEIPDNAYYGVQTMRAMENFRLQAILPIRFLSKPWVWSKKCGLGQYENRSFG